MIWRDLGWGVAAAVSLFVLGATIFYGLRALSKMDENDKRGKKLSEVDGLFNFSGSDNDPVETDPRSEPPKHPYVPMVTLRPATGASAAPTDEAYEDTTEEPEECTSSPYLFQPIRYMNVPKDKRSVYREYRDG